MSEIRNITVSTVQDVTFSSNMISDADIRAEYERRFGSSTGLCMEAKQIIRGIKQSLYLMKEEADSLYTDIESAQSKICENDGYRDSVHEAVSNLPSTPVQDIEDSVSGILNDLDYIETDVDLDDRHASDLYEKAVEADRAIIRLEELLGLEGDYTRDEDEGHDPSDDREPALENMTESFDPGYTELA